MGCDHIKLPGGGSAIVCSRGRRTQSCHIQGCRGTVVSLCDYPVERKGKKATCDAPMCSAHRHTVSKTEDDSVDWCSNCKTINATRQEG